MVLDRLKISRKSFFWFFMVDLNDASMRKMLCGSFEGCGPGNGRCAKRERLVAMPSI